MKIAPFYHCSLKPMSRSDGKSAVNCVAYRTGSKLVDEHYGQIRDYSHKKDVVTGFTIGPEHDPQALWNSVEKKENRKNSILGYEWEIAAPNELDDAHRENLARNISGWLRAEYGVAVTTGIHNGGDRGNGKNDHFHIVMTSRAIDDDGVWAKNKLREFTTPPGIPNPEVDRVRAKVAEFINATLADNDSETRVTHESYAARGIEYEGTKHLGPKTSALERDGVVTDRGNINREILNAREAVEARLVWQAEQAQPEITEALAQEFSVRFGDEWKIDERESVLPPSDAPGGGWVEEARAATVAEAMQPEIARVQATGTTHWSTAILNRLRAVTDSFFQMLRDEGSSTPVEQPQAEPRSEEAATTSPADAGAAPTGETEKSWRERIMESRVMQAGRHLLQGWSHKDGTELIEGVKDTAAIVQDILAKGPHPSQGPRTPTEHVADVPDATAPPVEAPGGMQGYRAAFNASQGPTENAPGAGSELERFRASFNARPQAGASKPAAPTPEPSGPEL